MSVVEIELFPELFGRMAVNPLDTLLDRIGRAAIAGQRVGGFLRRHGGNGDDASGWSVAVHGITPVERRPEVANYSAPRRLAQEAPIALTCAQTGRYSRAHIRRRDRANEVFA